MLFPRRFEISTLGSDEATQGLTTDPFLPSSSQTSLGLRIPAVLPTGPQPRYLFCLATANISQDWIIVRGIRQGLTLGCNVAPVEGGPSLVAEEFMVNSPFWRFPDGNVSWHLVREPNKKNVVNLPNADAQSWAFGESTDAAMLYNTFANSNTTPAGSPVQYDLGLTAYTPPQFNQLWQPIAGLGNFKDIRFPWQAPTNATGIDELVEGNCKISLYASVLQTNPATRPAGVYPAVSSIYPGGITPESAFVQSFSGVQYWRVFGSILFEHYQQTVSRPKREHRREELE